MDVQMPVCDGLEATRKIRELESNLVPSITKPLVIIAMTAGVLKGDREKCIASGMDDFIRYYSRYKI